MKKRGFIGPLGDDIPGIFPIVTGIFIFLISLGYVLQQVDARNQYLDLKQGTLELSYIATEKGFMPDDEFIDGKCAVVGEVASKNHLEYAMVLKKYCGAVDVSSSLTLKDHTADGYEPDLLCASPNAFAPDPEPAASVAGTPVVFPAEKVFTMTFPMAVECKESTKGMGLLTVAGWRK